MRASTSVLPLILAVVAPANECSLSTATGTGELHISGTVHFLEAEHGCWQLDASDGRRYELMPDQAPAAVLRDLASVSLMGRPADASDTGCRVGVPIEVRRVVSVDVLR